jgi:hypothetical protein
MDVGIKTTLRRGAFLGLGLLLCAGTASAQVYKWVDAAGKTHFSDTPPPEAAKAAPLKSGSAVGSASAEMPYALASAMRNHPVTLYTTSSCGGCDAGRAYLRGRGIPFSEKTVSNAGDEAKLRAAGGDGNLPFLMVGSAKTTGYQQGSWDSMLNAAQYPAKKVLPSSYQYPAAVAAAPAAPKAADAVRADERQSDAEQEEQAARKKAFAPQTAPPGFRF